ncbi:nitroreductase family protein [Streptomyces erythrochromogenes]|uniref:nitroreductase family protein n=1 Tax=Streptomyces erythrochromogenes TaxID=285574 RepID=UPI00368A3832
MFSAASRAFQEDLDQRGLLREYAVKDAVIAASFVMLAATEMGLATSPMNGWADLRFAKGTALGRPLRASVVSGGCGGRGG